MNTQTPSTPPAVTVRREDFADGLTLRFDERGSGRPILALHGGGGPITIAGFVEPMATRAHVLAPTHPGFAGEPRPEWFTGVDDLAIAYLDLLERLNLRDVIVVGFSMGGWIAAEMAVRDSSRIGAVVLVDAAGIEVEGHEIADVFSLTPDQLSALSYHNPAAFRIDPATITPERAAAVAANFQALAVYARAAGMRDPKLRRRLSRVKIPALVVWGESDGVIDPDYGRAYAQAFANARFELILEAGHMAQIEQRGRLLNTVWDFVASIPTTRQAAG